MSASAPYRIRRATIDDLAQLAEVWKATALPAVELEVLFTEFQVAEDAQGRIVGAIGLQVTGSDGRIHSESFLDFALSDTVRPLFWQRLEMMAHSHNLFRLWTSETAPFWKKDAGFSTAQTPAPEAFGSAVGSWLSLRLKDESANPDLLEAQFAIFRDAERIKREKLLQRASVIKMIGTAIAVLLFLFSLGVGVWLLRHKR